MRQFHLLKNFYVAATLGLLVWIVFFELNSIPTQIENAIKLRDLAKEKQYYLKEIELLKKEENNTLSNDQLREKYAREKYFMKKPNEDVFVLVDENGDFLEK